MNEILAEAVKLLPPDFGIDISIDFGGIEVNQIRVYLFKSLGGKVIAESKSQELPQEALLRLVKFANEFK